MYKELFGERTNRENKDERQQQQQRQRLRGTAEGNVPVIMIMVFLGGKIQRFAPWEDNKWRIEVPVIMIMFFLGGIIQRFLASPPQAEGAHSAPTKHD